MTNITLDGLPAKTGTISDAGIVHYREAGVDKKMTISDLLTKISSQYENFINTFLSSSDTASARAALDIARRTAVSNADYTIIATDKVVAQTGTMTAARTFTLPAASAYPAGEELIVIDQSGTVNFANNITITRTSSDTIDGETSMSIAQKYGILVLISDGVSKWKLKNTGSPILRNQFSNKNAIINGDFNIWQRGTSFTSVADSTYTADRFLYFKSGAMVHDISRSSDVPTIAQAGRLFNYSALIDCQTVDSSIATGDFCIYQQKVEGYNWLPLAQKIVTVSFWFKATKTGTYCASLGNVSPFDRSIVKEFTVNASDTWEYKTLTFSASPSAGTWDYTNGVGVRLSICLAAGATYQTTADAWQTGNYYATTNQVNACDSTSNNFKICGIQLESGSVATPFEQRSFQQEVTLCQRYFEKSYELGTPIDTVTALGEVLYSNQASQSNYVSVGFKTTKRATPTITISNPVTAGNSIRNYSASTNLAATVADSSDNRFNLRLTSVGTLTDLGFHWYASSEL